MVVARWSPLATAHAAGSLGKRARSPPGRHCGPSWAPPSTCRAPAGAPPGHRRGTAGLSPGHYWPTAIEGATAGRHGATGRSAPPPPTATAAAPPSTVRRRLAHCMQRPAPRVSRMAAGPLHEATVSTGESPAAGSPRCATGGSGVTKQIGVQTLRSSSGFRCHLTAGFSVIAHGDPGFRLAQSRGDPQRFVSPEARCPRSLRVSPQCYLRWCRCRYSPSGCPLRTLRWGVPYSRAIGVWAVAFQPTERCSRCCLRC